VHIISVLEERQRGLTMGAAAYLTKPVAKETLDEAFSRINELLGPQLKRLLLVEDNDTERAEIVRLLGNGDLEITAVGTGKEALAALKKQHFECMILDLILPDMSGFEILEEISRNKVALDLPVIVHTIKDLSKKEEKQLRKYADSIIIKGAESRARLLDETALFLHRVERQLPPEKQKLLRQLHEPDAALQGKKILIVDDDMRNIFALTSVLESHGLTVIYAENGREGIETLHAHPDTAVVLMDIMMPEMDGYECSRLIREEERYQKLPIIALTAKAMKGDREKCIDAGASDYLSKPADPDRLLSLMRVWLFK